MKQISKYIWSIGNKFLYFSLYLNANKNLFIFIDNIYFYLFFSNFNIKNYSYFYYFFTECSPSEYKCRAGNCIDINRRCDRNPDCPDGDDEDDSCRKCFNILFLYFIDLLIYNKNLLDSRCIDYRKKANS